MMRIALFDIKTFSSLVNIWCKKMRTDEIIIGKLLEHNGKSRAFKRQNSINIYSIELKRSETLGSSEHILILNYAYFKNRIELKINPNPSRKVQTNWISTHTHNFWRSRNIYSINMKTGYVIHRYHSRMMNKLMTNEPAGGTDNLKWLMLQAECWIIWLVFRIKYPHVRIIFYIFNDHSDLIFSGRQKWREFSFNN